MTQPMLEVKDLHAFYGKSHVLRGVNMEIMPGEVIALLGRNGVGRSTTAKAIMIFRFSDNDLAIEVLKKGGYRLLDADAFGILENER